MYLLLVIAAMLFAAQFVFNQRFQNLRGSGLDSTLLFQMNVGMATIILMLLLNRFHIRVTLFSAIMALILAIDTMCYLYFSMKAFVSANLSVYSIFAMLGGMLLPFVYGTAFCNEEITVTKVICCVFIAVSLALTFENGKSSTKCRRYYLAVFVFNGLMGVINKIHQSNTEVCTDSRSFVAMAYIGIFGISLVWYIIRNRRIAVITPKELTLTSCYALCNGIAELFCLIALTKLPASVQYPIITGGVIFFSTLVSILVEKQRSMRSICSTVIALLSTVVIAL